MKPGAGHVKGAVFERQVCKDLSLWISNGERNDLLWRTSMSGGRATLQLREGATDHAQAGDVSGVAQAGFAFVERFLVECKHHADLQLVSGFLTNRGKLHGFWQQLCGGATKLNRFPILICRQNRQPTLLLTTPRGADSLGLSGAAVELGEWNCRIWRLEDVLSVSYKVPHPRAVGVRRLRL